MTDIATPSASIDTGWRRQYDRLVTFTSEHGRLPWMNHNRLLYAWMQQQRRAYEDGLLTAEQIRLLESRPGWSWYPRDREGRWQRRCDELVAFIRKHDRLPRRVIKQERQLAQWLATQRSVYGERLLSEAQQKRLAQVVALSPKPVPPSNAAVFARNKAIMLRYVEVHGHALPDPDEVFEGVRLWKWQRRLALVPLTESTRQGLGALPGWIWDADEAWWQVRRRRLAIAAGSGPVNETNPGLRLRAPEWDWAVRQREAYAAATLSQEYITALEALPGWHWADPAAAERAELAERIRQGARLLLERPESCRARLSDRERDVIQLRLLPEQPVKYNVIGNRWGVTEERARQVSAVVAARALAELDRDDTVDAVADVSDLVAAAERCVLPLPLARKLVAGGYRTVRDVVVAEDRDLTDLRGFGWGCLAEVWSLRAQVQQMA